MLGAAPVSGHGSEGAEEPQAWLDAVAGSADDPMEAEAVPAPISAAGKGRPDPGLAMEGHLGGTAAGLRAKHGQAPGEAPQAVTAVQEPRPDPADARAAVGQSTPGDEKARRGVEERLQYYRELKLKKAGQRKPDMIACKEMAAAGMLPEMRYGLVPGVEVGEIFREKGELEVAGLHKGIMRGIAWPKDMEPGARGAYSIILSGAYHDDRDEGDAFDYTGMGLQGNQTYTAGNLALKYNIETGTPVRVIRYLEKDKNSGVAGYIYDGLYDVVRTWTEQSKDKTGRTVIMFRLEKHRDNTKAAGPPVVFRPAVYSSLCFLQLGRYRSTTLVTNTARPKKAQKTSQASLDAKEEQRLGEVRARPGLLCEDISGGKEPVRIPVINTEDDEPMPRLEYVASTVLSSAARAQAERAAKATNRLSMPLAEGLRGPVTPALGAYDGPRGILPCICPEGIDEAFSPHRYQLVSRGIQLPLEVFKTPGGVKGWGVRCSEFISGGTFVCEYAGHLITDEEAEHLTGEGDSDYFFAMDHFHLMLRGAIEASSAGGSIHLEPIVRREIQERFASMQEPPVIDARRIGNVGRFINHSEEGNLSIQIVFTDSIHSLIFYRVAFFANQDIQPFTELCYDYGYSHGPKHLMPAWLKPLEGEATAQVSVTTVESASATRGTDAAQSSAADAQ
uniref:Euchromatic histone-lysine N-methyltransferase n=1 Tax=Tetraselmis sp. GSL018 TaxID=582737 RepID=A0A061SCI8_9CHLO